ncbi:hypothetical protein HpDR126_13310 [Helicobacter pylori]
MKAISSATTQGSQRFDEIPFLGHYEASTDKTYEKLKDELKKSKKKANWKVSSDPMSAI